MQMDMDSYFYPGYFHDEPPSFYPHAAVPPSPELPFGLIASPAGDPTPSFVTPMPTPFHDYHGAGPEPMPPAMETPPGAQPQHQQPPAAAAAAAAVESSRGFRHMMRERQRREKLSQSYADLYAMVAARSKGDKNSIVQSAAVYIHELKGAREQLRRRNEELKARIMGHDARQQCVRVQFEVDEPASAVDSMIGALKRLKSMDVRARGIRSTLSGHRLWTEMNVETTIAAGEVEKAVEEALMQEVERKQQQQPKAGGSGGPGFPGTSSSPSSGGMGWGPQASSHVQNVF